MTLPDTNTLDIPYLGGPPRGLYQITGSTPALSTFDLDVPALGGPPRTLFPKIYPLSLTGTINVSGSIATKQGKINVILLGGIAVSSGILKRGSQSFPGGLSLSGALSKAFPVSFQGGIAMSASFAKLAEKNFSGGIAISGTINGPASPQEETELALFADQGTAIVSITLLSD